MTRRAARRACLCAVVQSSLWLACGQDSTEASLRSLGPAGEMSVVCLERDAAGRFTKGADLSECPDFVNGRDADGQRRLHALVTQPQTGEVALVDLTAPSTQAVIDFEPTQPGFSFMPVGAEPGSIESTPGGVASFVAVAEPRREGIFALPTTCIGARPEDAPVRDIRSWPACRLPVAPGPISVLSDPAVDHDGDPTTPSQVRASCDGAYVEAASLIGTAPGAQREACGADLALERQPGRRKLAVALPALGEIWLLDAQSLLDRVPGSFEACVPERRIELDAAFAPQPQRLPEDLASADPSCMPTGLPHGPADADVAPWPSDFALDDEGRLFVSDLQVPLVHVLDVSRPCDVRALAPLQPVSFDDPAAVVTTRRVAVSDLTAAGERFAYAVDNSSTRTAGTLMVFDVSPGATQVTPIVRPRAAHNPGEPADRISVGRPVADVAFVTQDFPRADPESGVAIEGRTCEPHPLDFPRNTVEASYRTSSDLASGARPTTLRGTFAFAALHTGQVVVIDVDDLDAACRRPATSNPGDAEDIYGCRLDDPSLPFEGYVDREGRTVSDELSCNLVAPHRVRSGGFFSNSTGTRRSVRLRSFPTLTLETGRSAATDQTEEGRDQPKMLAARHAAGVNNLLYVGALIYNTEDPSNRLEVDPALAERSSLLLSYREPRAYSPSEEFTASYEGVVRGLGRARLLTNSSGLGVLEEGINASFCASGVQDVAVTRDVGRGLGVSSADLDAFARRHADYAQLTGELLEADDAYWMQAAGASCGLSLFESESDGEAASRLSGRALCEQFFGPPQSPSQWRDLRIVTASEDRLEVEPRAFDPTINSPDRRRALIDFASCCFPGSAPFVVRAGHQWVVRGSASGVPHRVKADPDSGRCIQDCNPVVQNLRGRAFEISCSENCPTDERGRPYVGLSRPGVDLACVVDDATDGIDPGEPGAECVFQSLTTRFAIYRGLEESTRDMRFRWQLGEGFDPLTRSLTSGDATPRSLTFIPPYRQLAITDGTVRGLTFLSPRNLSLSSVF